jgi:phosphoglycolate phosphatase-like HAD superfamily hydrolase
MSSGDILALEDEHMDTAVLDVDGTLIDSVYAHVWS